MKNQEIKWLSPGGCASVTSLKTHLSSGSLPEGVISLIEKRKMVFAMSNQVPICLDGIYAFDNHDMLIYNRGWEIRARCEVCGELPMYCICGQSNIF